MRIPGPGELVGSALRAAGQGVDTLEQAVGLLPKAVQLLGSATELIDRADQLLNRTDALMDRINKVVDTAQHTADRAGRLVGSLEPTMATLQPTLDKLQPILSTLADTTSPEEVQALVQIVDLLPEITRALHDDVLPILRTMDSVSPDISNLLLMSQELNEMLSVLPGLGRAKRKFEEENPQQENTSPPSAGLPPGTTVVSEQDADAKF